MSTATVSLRAADRAALEYVETLLERNALPAEDVRARPDCFYFAVRDGNRVGVGGLEVNGTAGLLRSVVVEEAYRGQGVGGALVAALEERAADNGVGTLYLLTTTAAPFFAARGYEELDRERVPPAIRETTEFAELCPASATCMHRSLS